MDVTNQPHDIRDYLYELRKRKAIGIHCLNDRAFLNYLYTHKLDMDYVRRRMPATSPFTSGCL